MPRAKRRVCRVPSGRRGRGARDDAPRHAPPALVFTTRSTPMSANWRQKIDPQALPTASFDWGLIKWFVTPDVMSGANLTFGEVVLLPGLGHDRHNHLDAEEILYILSGEGMQMVDDGEPFPVKAGDVVYIPI